MSTSGCCWMRTRGLLFVGLAKIVAGRDGSVDEGIERVCAGDAGAVRAEAAEAGKRVSVGPEIPRLALALDGHGEHESKRVFPCAQRAGEDERVGQTTGSDGCAQPFDGFRVAEEVVEGCGKGRGWHHGRSLEHGWNCP